MLEFPTLSINPSYPLKEEIEDSVIRSDFEGGYEQTRPRFTRQRKTFTVVYKLLPDADKQTLENFYQQLRGGADAFTWTHPVYGTTHTVRFTKPIKFEYVFYNHWNAEIELREV